MNRSDGLQLKYQYGPNWDLQGVVAINNAYEYCDPNAAACAPSQTWPSSGYTWGSSSAGTDTVLTISDSGGRTTRYTLDNFGRVRSVKPPSSASDLYFFDYCLRQFQYNPYAYWPPRSACLLLLLDYHISPEARRLSTLKTGCSPLLEMVRPGVTAIP